MLDFFKRWVVFNVLNLKREPEHAPQIELASLMPLLVRRIEAGEAVDLVNNKTAAVRITDLKEFTNEKAIVLLFQYADSKVTAPVFSHLESGELREEPLLEGEGVAVSAHIAISLVPKKPDAPLYDFLVEEIPGLGRSRLAPFLKKEFKVVSKDQFEWEDDTENNRSRVYKPAIELATTASITLKEELDAGSVISGLELVAHKPKGKRFDEPNSYEEMRRTVVLKVVSNEGILGKINKLMAAAREEGFTEYKLHYKNQGGKQKTALLGTTKEDVADSLLGRTEEVKADEPLAQCQPAICESIARQMVGFITSARG